ncbi:ArsR/SmtB family transcription factor [Kiloniella litopenaei]|uniref:ArsR/SmtB family transcription factor n=1 Tax=Kiloniella litopenaei TaxID=1549748 RepID=UPI003BA969D6
MEINKALSIFSALSQPTRLEIVRLLIKSGDNGLLAGEISETLNIRPNTASTNLLILVNSHLLRKERQGRTIRYFVDFEAMKNLLTFLMEDCCGGNPELCQPIIDKIACTPDNAQQ